MALPVAAVALIAGSQIMQGVAQGNAAHYQAQVATNNATIERNNAMAAAQAASSNIEQASLKESQKQAGLKAGLAANGIDVATGSAANVQASQREIGNLNTANVAHNEALQVYGYESQATNYQAQSKLESEEGDFDYISGGLKAAGTVAGNADSLGFGSDGDAGGGAQSFSPGATGAPTSLISSMPSVPQEYSWMQENGNGVIY